MGNCKNVNEWDDEWVWGIDMMKKTALLLMMAALVVLTGCNRCADSVVPRDNGESAPSVGLLHNELLERIYMETDGTLLSKVEREAVICGAVNEFAAKHDLEPLTSEDVNMYIRQGKEMALGDPLEMIESMFSPDEMIWWERFIDEAEPSNTREVFEMHSDLYGAPEAGSTLECVGDICVCSAEFWYKRYKDRLSSGDMYKYQNPQTRLLRFLVVCLVDAGAGAAASGAGPVVGAVVGGLASHGADDILY